MCDTSNSPTAVRTAICSAIRPEYSTGMSHPPKSTILAFAARCAAFSAVLRSVSVSDIMLNSLVKQPFPLSTIASAGDVAPCSDYDALTILPKHQAEHIREFADGSIVPDRAQNLRHQVAAIPCGIFDPPQCRRVHARIPPQPQRPYAFHVPRL